jgi:hypothetical protein
MKIHIPLGGAANFKHPWKASGSYGKSSKVTFGFYGLQETLLRRNLASVKISGGYYGQHL